MTETNPAIIASCEQSMMLNDEVDHLLEEAVLWANQTYGETELVSARDEFFWKTGKVFHDDPPYRTRISYFLDFFLFERPLGSAETCDAGEWLTPFNAYNQRNKKTTAGGISSHRHSLFEVIKTGDESVLLRDMLNNERITVTARQGQSLKLLSKKQIFQGFLYHTEEERWVLSQGLLFHPANVWKLLNKTTKRLLKSSDLDELEALTRFARLELRTLRHPHVDARRTYLQELNA